MGSLMRALARSVYGALVLLVSALMLLIFVQIVMRYQFGRSLAWSLEVSQILFVWIVFLGAALGVKQRQFGAMDLLASRLPRWWSQRVVFFVIVAFAGVFCALAVAYLGQTSAQRLTMTGLSSTVIYAAPVAGAVLMMAFGLEILFGPAFERDATTAREAPG